MPTTGTELFSAINISCPWRGIAVIPDGSIDQAERQAIAFLYSGILAGAPVQARVTPQPDPLGGEDWEGYWKKLRKQYEEEPPPAKPPWVEPEEVDPEIHVISEVLDVLEMSDRAELERLVGLINLIDEIDEE